MFRQKRAVKHGASTTHSLGHLRFPTGVYPHSLDAHLQTVVKPLIHVAGASRCDRPFTSLQETREYVGLRQDLQVAARSPESTDGFPKYRICWVEGINNLRYLWQQADGGKAGDIHHLDVQPTVAKHRLWGWPRGTPAHVGGAFVDGGARAMTR